MSDYGNEPERYPWEHHTSPMPGEPPMVGSGDSAVVEYLRAELRKATVPSPVPAGTERAFAEVLRAHAWDGFAARFVDESDRPHACVCGEAVTDHEAHVAAALAAAVASSPATPVGADELTQRWSAAARREGMTVEEFKSRHSPSVPSPVPAISETECGDHLLADGSKASHCWGPWVERWDEPAPFVVQTADFSTCACCGAKRYRHYRKFNRSEKP